MDNEVVVALAATNEGIFAGTGSVYLSRDRGETWTKKSNGITAGIRTLHADGGNVYAGTWAGLFHSNNNGESWNKISNGLPGESIGYIAHMGETLFAATQHNGLYKTSDGGQTWESVHTGFATSLAVRHNHVFIGTLDQKLFVSADKGNTWTDITGELPNTLLMAIKFTDSDILIGTSYGFGLWTRPITEIMPRYFEIYSDYSNSEFRIGQPIFIKSDQALLKMDGDVLDEMALKDNIVVKNSQDIEMEYSVTISADKKLIAVIIDNAQDGESYKITLQPFKNVSGLSSTTFESNSFIAFINHVPFVNNISVQGPQDKSITFSEAMFGNAFSDSDAEPLSKIVIKSLPQHGILSLNGTPLIINTEVMTAALGQLTYTPEKNFSGNDQWTWNGSDRITYATLNALFTIEITPVTALLEEDIHRNIKLYPNPVSGILNVELPGNMNGSVSVMMLDLAGREIKSSDCVKPGELICDFDVSDVPEGIYIIQIGFSGKQFNQRVIKR